MFIVGAKTPPTPENLDTVSKPLNSPTAEQISQVIRNHFGIDDTDIVVSVELLLRASNPETYDRLRLDFETALRDHPNSDLLRKRKDFGAEFAVFLETTYPRAEVEGLREDLTLHYPVCTREEIERIDSPETAADYLLTVRANEIADNARLKRVFLRRRDRRRATWSLTSHFDRRPFKEYLSRLPREKRLRCQEVEAGFAFLREANGACIRSPFGNVIVISETLKEYLFFMNLFLLTQDGSIPTEDAAYSLLIAARIMLMSEAPDFDLDPRGTPSGQIRRHCKALGREQLQFIIGHEYAHHFLGHLGSTTALVSAHGMLPGSSGNSAKVYSRSQEQEFEADAAALLESNLSDEELAARLNAASWFFLGLDVWQAIKDFLAPPMLPRTHPSARDRLNRLRESILTRRAVDIGEVGSDQAVRSHFDRMDRLKEALCNKFLPLHVEDLERYGSMYLPSYRPSVLRDRIDF